MLCLAPAGHAGMHSLQPLQPRSAREKTSLCIPRASAPFRNRMFLVPRMSGSTGLILAILSTRS